RLEGVFERDGREAVRARGPRRNRAVQPDPVRQHERDVADDPGAKRRAGLGHRVRGAAFDDQRLFEVGGFGYGPQVVDRAADDRVVLLGPVAQLRLAGTEADAGIQDVPLTVDQAPPVTD